MVSAGSPSFFFFSSSSAVLEKRGGSSALPSPSSSLSPTSMLCSVVAIFGALIFQMGGEALGGGVLVRGEMPTCDALSQIRGLPKEASRLGIREHEMGEGCSEKRGDTAKCEMVEISGQGASTGLCFTFLKMCSLAG